MVSLNRLTVLINHKVFEPVNKPTNKHTYSCKNLDLEKVHMAFCCTHLFSTISFHLQSSYNGVWNKILHSWYLCFGNSQSCRLTILSKFKAILQPFNDIYNILIPSLCILTVLSILFNAASVIFLRSLNIQRKKAESNFLIIMSITTLFQLIGAIVTVILLKFRTSIYPILSTIMPFVSDGLSLVQPWLLLFFSNAVSFISNRDRNSIYSLLFRPGPFQRQFPCQFPNLIFKIFRSERKWNLFLESTKKYNLFKFNQLQTSDWVLNFQKHLKLFSTFFAMFQNIKKKFLTK